MIGATHPRLQAGDMLVTYVLAHSLSPTGIDRSRLLVEAGATVLAVAFVAVIVFITQRKPGFHG